MKIYFLGKGVYKDYIKLVKGNENTSHELAAKKLTRDIHLSHHVKIDDKLDLYIYGNLNIFVKNNNKIVKLAQCDNTYSWFKKDKEKYKELNEQLGIAKQEKLASATNIDDLIEAINKVIPKNIQTKDVKFVCIGTDRSTGDALAPIVGTALIKLGYDVIGTLDSPVHAENINEVVSNLPKDKTIIAIGSALGKLMNVGKIAVNNSGHSTGAGVGKIGLPVVGDYCISGIVNVSGFMEYAVLQNTRLSVVTNMSDMIIEAVQARFKL